MSNKISRIRRQFNNALKRKQDILATFAGVMGDGLGNVQVTEAGKENFSYVRINDNVQEVLNTRMPLQEGLRVVVGFDASQPDLLQVLGARTATPYGNAGRGLTHYAPASYYEWMGSDPIFIDKRLWLPRRISHLDFKDPLYTGLSVWMYWDMFWDGTDWIVLPSQIIDLSGYVPSSGKTSFVLITINASGAVMCTKGDEVTTADILPADIPAPPSGTVDVLAAVRLYYGQTDIVETLSTTDILDLRFTYFSGNGGEIAPAEPAVLIEQSIANISNPPIEAELISALGTPDENASKIFVLNDNGAGLNEYLVLSDGGHYWVMPLAKTFQATVSITVSETAILATEADRWFGRATLERLSSGIWVLVYLEGSAHYINDDVVHIRFSDDEGETWTAEDTYLDDTAVSGFPAYPTGAGPADPQGPGDTYIFEAPNGDLWLHTWKVDYDGNDLDGCWHVKSTNGGKTWGAWSQINWIGLDSATDNLAMGTEQHFILNDVIYLAGRIHQDATGAIVKNVLFTSSDNGETWTYISDMDSFTTNTLECAMEYLGNDTILCYLRALDHIHAYMVKSIDMGLTWSAPVEVQNSLGILGRNRLYTRSHLKGYSNWWNDRVLVMCGYVQQTPGSSLDRRNAIWVSQDGGTNWIGPSYVDNTDEDGGYGDILFSVAAGKYKFINYYGTQLEAVLKQYDCMITGI